MEMKRLGLAHKPMIVVPNHLVEQWGAAFLQLYPQANIFVAGKDYFAAGNRQKAMARIATGNYDAVIVSHSSFEFLPVSDETFGRFVGKQIDQLEDADSTRPRPKKATTAASSRNWRKPRSAWPRNSRSAPTASARTTRSRSSRWASTGFSCDEADLFKNLGFSRKMTRIAGLPEHRKQPRARYVHEDAVSRGARRRHRLRHRHADLEHHGRDVHAAALSRAGRF